MYRFWFQSWELILQFVSSRLMKQYVTIGAQLLWCGRYGYNKLWLCHCDVIHWDKQSYVTMAADL